MSPGYAAEDELTEMTVLALSWDVFHLMRQRPLSEQQRTWSRAGEDFRF
jgi:hypothetical protein